MTVQVLVDLGGLARLEWRHWDMFTRPEIGTVAFNAHTFIGRAARMATESPHRGVVIGELDFNRGLSGNIRTFVSVNTTELSVEGEALVEIEPTAYRLENISLITWREKIRDREVFLGTLRLARAAETSGKPQSAEEEVKGGGWVRVDGSLTYGVNVSRYWGHLTGTVRGLPARATLANATYRFKWGLPWEGREEGAVVVGAELTEGTYTLATLQAGTQDMLYTGSSSHKLDGKNSPKQSRILEVLASSL